ncbi:hypothetical protein C1646_773318 [Rhizophagus diaphanus]|nr:hypothetical protein C1646_773318 [Rhizophagus diaphanus] [Rhizophagus sp. MUCL 43196]
MIHNPYFHCICDGKDSGTQQSATAAINNMYSQIFSNKTKYSGLAVMEFDNEAIVHELVADISFIPIFIRLDQILIVISKIGVSSREGCYGASPRYLSTLITKYADKRSLFDTTPNKIWETISILKKYDGATLFGITDYNIQQILTELNKLEKSKNLITCTNLSRKLSILRKRIRYITSNVYASSCTNITPFMKKQHLIKFWTKAPDPLSDRENLAKLFESEMLLKSLQKALEINKRGIDGNVRILSIIAKNFIYKKLKEKFKIGSDIINSAQKYVRLNGPDNILQKINNLKRHLHRDYERELVVNTDGTTIHNPCISHCLPYAFGKYSEKHTSRFSECDKFFEFFEFMHLHIMEDQVASLNEIKEHLQYFLAHATRKIYLNTQFKAILASLDENGALFIADYKMRILPRFTWETKAEFFGKCGWILHTILVFTKKKDCKELDVRTYDYWSTDTKQDTWFTASSFEAVFETIKYKPKWIKYQIEVRDWQFLIPSEAKTTIDLHHAAISHSIKRYIQIGFDICNEEDIAL